MASNETMFWIPLTPTALVTGLSLLSLQCVLYAVFATRLGGVVPPGPWSAMPGFTAHQIVQFPLLVLLVSEGVLGWHFADSNFGHSGKAALERTLGIGPHTGVLSEAVVGAMLFWDLPTGVMTRALWDPAIMAHHIGMLATASLACGALSTSGKPILGHYEPFFFGFIELSSLPLVVVNMFHPKHRPWFAYLDGDHAPICSRLLNKACWATFALSHLVIRVLYLTHVVVFGVIPDILYVAALPEKFRDGASLAALYGMAGLSVLFTILQLYWGCLVVRQLYFVIFPKQKAKDR